jgi:hypothetical protein
MAKRSPRKPDLQKTGEMMNLEADGSSLIDFFENHEHRLIHKWMHYFEIYDRHFSKVPPQTSIADRIRGFPWRVPADVEALLRAAGQDLRR